MPAARVNPALADPVATPRRVAVERAPGWMVWMCLAIVYVVWGSTYLAIRVADETMPPLLTSGVRFGVAGVLMWTVLRVRRGRDHMRVTREQVLSCAIVGALLVAGGNGLVMVGELHVPSGVAALIIASVPLWVVVYRWVGGERVPRATLAGVALGFAGVALLLLPGGSGGDTRFLSLLFLVMAAPCWALGSYLSKRRALPPHPLLSPALQMMLGGAASVLAGAGRGELGGV